MTPDPAHRLDGRFKQGEAIGAADGELAGALRMRHQADDVPSFAADARDAAHRAVGIGAGRRATRGVDVAKYHLTVLVEPCEDGGVRVVVPFAVRDGEAQHPLWVAGERERGVRLLDLDVHVLASEMKAVVAQ